MLTHLKSLDIAIDNIALCNLQEHFLEQEK